MDQSKEYELTLKEYENFFNRRYKSLCLFANEYVNDLDDSEDIVQNVFIKVWEDKVSFKSKDKIESFFYTAVKNKSLDFLRSKYVKNVNTYPLEDLEALQTENYNLPEAVILETSDIIERELKALPSKAAKAIRLSIENYKNKEIAEEMNISIHTVKSYKKESYQKLRKTLSFLRIV
ncbi:sigma-70 family RNA polymerase sigma factor [Flavivirga jejuensis]|uniref:Sigma-70 family RNA polymerase sigma factor n=1 Tax=Flavivirga jejuensis TaxID=870487 RepID=A0ABT8WTV6_9FLAO|nr:sigma-70 family RNA polymerase sigma factor [Flavivirga jejuensis]MDO5976529.1 sigma-70 family RNA polymerase sigma factor [Flavivirga jejuensis]